MLAAIKNSAPGFLLLAAGSSQRFGESCKLSALMEHGVTVIDQTLKAITSVERKVMVVVSESSPLPALLAGKYEHTLFPGHSPGIGDSIAWGVSQTASWQGWVICLADMPWITAAVYRAVINLAERENRIISPSYKGQRGHPVFFPTGYRKELIALKGDRGANGIIGANSRELLTIETGCAGVLKDIDVPEDLSGYY